MNPISQASGNPQFSTTTTTSSADFQHLDAYPWSSDPTFQVGLSAILQTQGDGLDAPQLEELVSRARCFYFLRYVVNRAIQPALVTQHPQEVRHQHRSHSLPVMASLTACVTALFTPACHISNSSNSSNPANNNPS